MNIRIQYIPALLSLCLTSATAQIRIDSVRITKTGDEAVVRFTGQVESKATGRNYKLTVTPALCNGKESVSLPPIVVETRRTRIMDSRDRINPQSGSVVTANGKSFDYVVKKEYRKWFPGAVLRLDKQRSGCGSEHTLPSVFPNVIVQIRDNDTLHIPFGGNELILVKNRPLTLRRDTISRETAEHLARLTVSFKVNSAELLPDLNDNRRMLDEITGVLQTAMNAPDVRIAVTGYASPEGPVELNNELAMKRAQAVRDYMMKSIPRIIYSDVRLIVGGENWAGLREAVSHSDMPGKEEVLRIIDDVPAEIDYRFNTSRKKQLMGLDGGEAWRYMQQEFFPNLRNAVSVTLYQSETSMTQPLPQIGDANGDTIDRACEMIAEGRTQQALRILLPIRDDPRAWNPIGVCYLLHGDAAQAQTYLHKASEAGYKEGGENLGHTPHIQ